MFTFLNKTTQNYLNQLLHFNETIIKLDSLKITLENNINCNKLTAINIGSAEFNG